MTTYDPKRMAASLGPDIRYQTKAVILDGLAETLHQFVRPEVYGRGTQTERTLWRVIGSEWDIEKAFAEALAWLRQRRLAT